jgi:hypothetical protein
MKTSNKILLIAFITALLILISINVTIYAKYRKGEFTVMTDDYWMPNMASFSMQDVKYVSIDNIENISVHASDSNVLKYDKGDGKDENVLTFNRRHDTLFVAGKSTRSEVGRWYRHTQLHINGGLSLKAINSNLQLDQKQSGGTIPKLNLLLDNANIDILSMGQSGNFAADISAVNKSRVFLGDVSAGKMQLRLRNSIVEEKNLATDSLLIWVDGSSQINMRAENLLKAKISSHQ